jgi:nucleoside-diphosphate-sugar epimerase
VKILFIGGTGNISGACTRLALKAGMEVVHLNRGRRPSPSGVRTVSADIHNPKEAAAALGGERFDAVANFIAFVPDDIRRDFELFTGKCGQHFFISSASAYQKPPASPWVTEATPLSNPFWQYSRNKIACEELLGDLYRDQGFPSVILRPSLTYETVWPVALGGWACYTIIDRIRRGLPLVVHGDGTSLWTVTHSEDFARGFIGLVGNERAVGEAFHITSDEVLTWNQIYETIGEAAGVKPRLVHIPSDFIAQVRPGAKDGLLGDKAHSLIFDNTKIKYFVPDFRAQISFREGSKRTLDWFESDPARMVIDEGQNAFLDEIISKYGHA